MNENKTPYPRVTGEEIARRVRGMLRLLPSRSMTSMARHLGVRVDKVRRVMRAAGLAVQREPAMSRVIDKVRARAPADVPFNRR